MPTSGQTALLSYVSSGHGLVTSEWTLFNTHYNKFQILGAAFPATNNGAYASGTSTTYAVSNAPDQVKQGLPNSFALTLTTNVSGTEASLTPKPGAATFYSTSQFPGHAGLAGWDYEAGRVANFSTLLIDLGDNNYKTLFLNTMEWAAAATPIPLPGAVWLLGSGLVGLISLRRFRRR